MTAPPYRTSAGLAALDGVAHGFFGRAGGVSEGVYASLNCGPGSADDPGAVVENRARAAQVLGVAPDRLLTARQTHSAIAVTVAAPWGGDRPEADALVATGPGAAVGVLAADCAPVLFADPEAHVVAAAHAGWKGACRGVLEACLDAMAAAGARFDRIQAAIGPCIAQSSYEVGPDFVEAFAGDDLASGFFKPGRGDRSHFDLPGYAAARLARSGVRRVEISGADTLGDEAAWFSRRGAVRAGHDDYGRNLSAIRLCE